MARGFWTGLGHGGILGAAALVALSLAAPLPDPAAAPDAVAVADPPRRDPASPRADAVGLPVGSEFGRGGDVAPRLPAPLTAPQPGVRTGDAPAVIAPAAEPSPVVAADDARPPATNGAPRAPAQIVPDRAEAPPAQTLPSTMADEVRRTTAPVMIARQADEAPALPDAVPPALTVAAPDGPVPETDAPAAAAVPATDGPGVAPGLPAPRLDLSLPPDMSDLRGLERD